MDSDNFLLTIAIIAVVVSVVGVSITYNSISAFENIITGYATEEGFVNVTIESRTLINITHADTIEGMYNLSWGSGYVSGGTYAILASNGTCTNCADWATINEGFRIENIGNVNVTLNVSSTLDSSGFPGGSSPRFDYNVTNSESGSCESWAAGYTQANYKAFTTSAETGGVCDKFLKDDSSDTLRMDILIQVPQDANPGDYNNVVTLTYDAVV